MNGPNDVRDRDEQKGGLGGSDGAGNPGGGETVRIGDLVGKAHPPHGRPREDRQRRHRPDITRGPRETVGDRAERRAEEGRDVVCEVFGFALSDGDPLGALNRLVQPEAWEQAGYCLSRAFFGGEGDASVGRRVAMAFDVLECFFLSQYTLHEEQVAARGEQLTIPAPVLALKRRIENRRNERSQRDR